jgi:hypothetical protein
MALYDIAEWEPIWIEQVAAPGLFLPAAGHDEACLIVPVNEGLAGIFLNGEWPFYCSPMAELSGRKGIFVPNVVVKVEFESMVEDNGDGRGMVVRSQGVHGVRAYRKPQGQHGQNVVVALNGGNAQYAANAVRLAFPKWEIGKQIDDEWASLWSVDVAA